MKSGGISYKTKKDAILHYKKNASLIFIIHLYGPYSTADTVSA